MLNRWPTQTGLIIFTGSFSDYSSMEWQCTAASGLRTVSRMMRFISVRLTQLKKLTQKNHTHIHHLSPFGYSANKITQWHE